MAMLAAPRMLSTVPGNDEASAIAPWKMYLEWVVSGQDFPRIPGTCSWFPIKFLLRSSCLTLEPGSTEHSRCYCLHNMESTGTSPTNHDSATEDRRSLPAGMGNGETPLKTNCVGRGDR